MSKKALITAKCDRCGDFKVVRRRKLIKSEGCQDRDLPGRLVCPSCGWHCDIVKVEDIK
jgi:hypothetical protein